MSDYYGDADLKDWLEEEVFGHMVTPEQVALFEKWRDAVERNIESWMGSDDGDGNRRGWRQWGMGFYAIPDADQAEFDEACRKAREMMTK
jgi:hypothetical protein